jgi:hypothetical protein
LCRGEKEYHRHFDKPDWAEYVDLTIYDKSVIDIFNESIDYGRDLLPEWSPQAGNIEVVLLESIAMQATNVIAAANRVPGAVMETLLVLYGIERDDGVKATATVAITLVNTSGYVVPAGTHFAYFPLGGEKSVVYVLDEDISVAAGGSVGTGDLTAIDIGTEFNNPPVGSALQILSTMPYLLSSILETQPSGGSDPETDTDFFTRASTTLRSYSGALTTPSQIQAWVLVTFPNDVYRCFVYDQRRKNDRDVTSSTYDTHDGYALVAVAGLNATVVDTSDVPLSVGQIDTISDELDLKTNTGLVTELVNAELVDVSVNVIVMPHMGYTSSQVIISITDALNSYLSPNEWNWADIVRRTEIIALIDGVEGVDYIVELVSLSSSSVNATVDVNGDVAFHLLGSLPVSTGHTISVMAP